MKKENKKLLKKYLTIIAFTLFFVLFFLVLWWPSFLFWGFTELWLFDYDIDIIPSGTISGAILIISTALIVDTLIIVLGVYLNRKIKRKWLFWTFYTIFFIILEEFNRLTFVAI